MVHTVLGLVEPEALGPTLMHEHVLCDFYRVTGHLDHLLNDEDLAREELGVLAAAGGAALVECTTSDMGRDPAGLARISRATDMHIVMGSGWYRQPFYPVEVDQRSVDELARVIVADLTTGVGETGVCAGVIGEIGVNLDYATAQEERVLRAAARAHLATGAPITTHASMYPVGHVQLDLLAEEGVDPAHVIIGHCDTYLDVAYHRAILERGAYVQFDTIGRTHMNPDERRADAIATLLQEGWAERLLLSSDRCYRSDLCAFGGVGYAHVFTAFRQLLFDRGVGSASWEQLTVGNPRDVLAW